MASTRPIATAPVSMAAMDPIRWARPISCCKPNMVLSYHPGTVLENDRGFLISDNFLVTPEGAFRLSPHHADRYYMQLEA